MRRRLKDVGPDVVEEVSEGVLTAEAVHAQRHVLDGRHGRLSVHQVSGEGGRRYIGLVNFATLTFNKSPLL